MKFLTKTVYFLIIVAEIIVMLRFSFLLFDASESNVLVNIVLSMSDYLVKPFRSIVDKDWSVGKFIIEVDSLVALLIYTIFGFGASQMVKLFSFGR